MSELTILLVVTKSEEVPDLRETIQKTIPGLKSIGEAVYSDKVQTYLVTIQMTGLPELPYPEKIIVTQGVSVPPPPPPPPPHFIILNLGMLRALGVSDIIL